MRKSGSNRISGNRNNGSNSGSRCSNWNNAPWNSNWNIGLRAACDDESKHLHHRCHGVGGRPAVLWSACCCRLRQTHYEVRRTASRGSPKAAPAFMGKKHKNLFQQVVDRDNLWRAYRKASLGKRNSLGYLEFRQNEAANIARLGERLAAGTYRPGEPRRFMVFEPKAREISALPFVDRVAQHALCNIIEPIFDQVFLPQSYACRKGKGTHAAARGVQSLLRKTPNAWILKTDFSKYFASIDRAILHREFRRKISCRQTLALLEVFIPVEGAGLPIGNLTSQLAANLYGHILDRWLLHIVGVAAFVRYMDDVVVIGHSREAMALLQMLMQGHAQNAMRLRFSHWSVQPAAAGVNFCGYRIWPTHKLLRKSSVQRARRKLARFAVYGDFVAKTRFLGAWLGHARHANTHHLLTHLGVEK